jgi:hypothetical protein
MSEPGSLIPNAHMISALIVASIADDEDEEEAMELDSRTDLDSPANMFVASKHAYILADSGKTATVRAFSPVIVQIETWIVDCVCPYTNKMYILVAYNALYVPTMTHNLVPPFLLLQEAGLTVNEAPKIQVVDPDISDHSIYFDGAKL